MARHQRVHPRRRPRVPHLLRQQPRRRGHGRHLGLPRPHRARPPGGMGRLSRRLPPDPAVLVVEMARRLRRGHMNDQAGGVRTETTATAAALIVTLGLAAASWVVAVRQMSGMDMGVATRLGSFAFFAGLWVTMMAAMMLPGAVPAVVR